MDINNNLEIERIDLNLVKELQKISIQTFRETFAKDNHNSDMEKYLESSFSTNTLKNEISNPESEFYLAKYEAKFAGYLKINLGEAQTEKISKKGIEIERIYVLKEFHGLKIGTSLLKKAISISKEKNLDFVWLGVWEKNFKAIRFYENYGFQKFGSHPFILGTDKQIDILMKLENKV